MQTLREDAAIMANLAVSSSPNPDDLPRLLTEARAKQKKAQETHEKAQKRIEIRKKANGGSDYDPSSAAIVKIVNTEAAARSALQAANDDVSRLENAIRGDEVTQQTNQGVDELEGAARTQGPVSSESTAPMLQGRSNQNAEQREDVTELRQQLATLQRQLEQSNTERERDKTEYRSQFEEFQQEFNKFRAKQEAETGDRQKKIDHEVRGEKDALRAEFKETVREIQVQARIDRDDDLSTHRNLLGQITTFQSEMATHKKDIAIFRRNNAKNEEDIDDMFKRISTIRDEVRTAAAKNLEKVNPLTQEVQSLTTWKQKTDASISYINQELTNIKKEFNSIRDQNKEFQENIDTTPHPDPNMVLRLDSLEAFQTSATRSMNNMSNGLKVAAKIEDLDVLQESLANVAFDAATDAAKAAAKEEANAVFDKLTVRIDAVETKVVPDEDVRKRLAACETDLTNVVKWVGQRVDDDPDEGTLTMKVANLETLMDGTPNLSDDHEDKVEGMTDIIQRHDTALNSYEAAVNNLSEQMAELEKPKPEQDEPNINEKFQAEINGRISDLESALETKRAVFQTQVNSSFEVLKQTVDQMITGSHNEISSRLSPLRHELQQERAARVDLDKRFLESTKEQSGEHANVGNLGTEIEQVKQWLNRLEKKMADQMNQLFGDMQKVNPDGIRKEIIQLYQIGRTTQAALHSLESRYNNITTTSLVQMMLDQIHRLLPSEKDFLSMVKDFGRLNEDVRQIRHELTELPDKLSLNNNSGMDETALLHQAVESYKKTVEEYRQKADEVEGRHKTLHEKISSLQYQLRLDDETLHSGDTPLRELMENSMAQIREDIEHLMPGQEQGSGVSEEVIQEKVKSIVGKDITLLTSEHHRLNMRVSTLEEESSKASTVSALDPTRYAKKAHVDELRENVNKLGTRVDKLEGGAKNAEAGADESEDGTPLIARKSSISIMGRYKVTDSPRQRSSSHKSRKQGPAHRSAVPDSEEER
jgi:chromosome segregation ATPase